MVLVDSEYQKKFESLGDEAVKFSDDLSLATSAGEDQKAMGIADKFISKNFPDLESDIELRMKKEKDAIESFSVQGIKITPWIRNKKESIITKVDFVKDSQNSVSLYTGSVGLRKMSPIVKCFPKKLKGFTALKVAVDHKYWKGSRNGFKIELYH